MDAARAAAFLPQWKSHKEVWAGRIEGLDGDQISVRASPILLLTVKAAPGMFARYTPAIGDFYVVYADGYAAISPKAAFEEGYTLKEAPPC